MRISALKKCVLSSTFKWLILAIRVVPRKRHSLRLFDLRRRLLFLFLENLFSIILTFISAYRNVYMYSSRSVNVNIVAHLL